MSATSPFPRIKNTLGPINSKMKRNLNKSAGIWTPNTLESGRTGSNNPGDCFCGSKPLLVSVSLDNRRVHPVGAVQNATSQGTCKPVRPYFGTPLVIPPIGSSWGEVIFEQIGPEIFGLIHNCYARTRKGDTTPTDPLSTNGVRWFREFSDSPNGTTRFYHSQNPTSTFGLDTLYFSIYRMLLGMSTIRRMLQFTGFRSFVSYLYYTFLKQQIESLHDSGIYNYVNIISWFGILWLYLGASVYVSQHRKTSIHDQRNSENQFLLIRKMTFYHPPPGVGGVSRKNNEIRLTYLKI